MALQYIGIDPDTGQGNCPTVWVDDKNDDLVLQGWLVDETTLAECRSAGPEHTARPRSQTFPFRCVGGALYPTGGRSHLPLRLRVSRELRR